MGYMSALDDFKKIDVLASGSVDFPTADLKIRTLNFHSNKVERFCLPNHPDVLVSS